MKNIQQNTKINKFRITQYILWIIKEVAKADWEVVKIILDEKINVKQNIIKMKINVKSDNAKTILANSITLTPGTITVETIQNYFIIHTLTKHDAIQKDVHNELYNMEDNVTKLEKI